MMITALCLILVIIAFASRVAYVVIKTKGNVTTRCARTLIVLGSGGHTAEMMRQVVNLNPTAYTPRLYVVADGDPSSKQKLKIVESRFADNECSVVEIPRSRKVGQSYVTSIFTSIYSAIKCVPIVFSFKPDLVLCNGPGTCIPICLIAFVLNVLRVTYTRIVFIESICRVNTLSLSGKILLPFADKVLVQWSDLKKKYPRTEYIGRLV